MSTYLMRYKPDLRNWVIVDCEVVSFSRRFCSLYMQGNSSAFDVKLTKTNPIERTSPHDTRTENSIFDISGF
jgi:hypothetical protein